MTRRHHDCCAWRIRSASAAPAAGARRSPSTDSILSIEASVADLSRLAAIKASRPTTSRGRRPAALSSLPPRPPPRGPPRRERSSCADARRRPVLRRLHASSDPLVLATDPAEQLEVVEGCPCSTSPARRRAKSGLSVMYSSRTRSLLSRLERDPALAAQPVETLGLVCDRAVEGGELLPGSGQLSLEHRETRLLRVDTRRPASARDPRRRSASVRTLHAARHPRPRRAGGRASPPTRPFRHPSPAAVPAVRRRQRREAGDSASRPARPIRCSSRPAEVPAPLRRAGPSARSGSAAPPAAARRRRRDSRRPILPALVVGLEPSQRRQRPITCLLRREALSPAAPSSRSESDSRRLAQERKRDHDDDRDDERRAQQEPHAHVVCGVSWSRPRGRSVASRRSSRASGQRAITDPSTKTSPEPDQADERLDEHAEEHRAVPFTSLRITKRSSPVSRVRADPDLVGDLLLDAGAFFPAASVPSSSPHGARRAQP